MPRVAFLMPRHAHDHVRVSHKEAWTVHCSGCEVVLLCRDAPAREYLGMRLVAARGRAESLLRPLLNAPSLLRQALGLRADLYVLENPDTLLVGFLLRLLRKRVVYSCHEDFLRKVELHPRIPRALRSVIGAAIVACELAFARIAAATLVTQPSVEARYRRRVLRIENAPLTAGPVVQEAARIYARLPTSLVPALVYAGAITEDRGLFRMLDLLVQLNTRRPWTLKLLGRFDCAADRRAAEEHPGWRHVQCLGQVSHAASLAHIRGADIGLALLRDVGGYSSASITKLYEYMLMETPFVASNFAFWRGSIDDTAAGLFVGQLSAARLAAEIDALFADAPRYARMQALGRDFIERRFNWSAASAPLSELLRTLFGERLQWPVSDACERRQSVS